VSYATCERKDGNTDMWCWRLCVRRGESYLQLLHPPFSHLNLVNRPFDNRATSEEGREWLRALLLLLLLLLWQQWWLTYSCWTNSSLYCIASISFWQLRGVKTNNCKEGKRQWGMRKERHTVEGKKQRKNEPRSLLSHCRRTTPSDDLRDRRAGQPCGAQRNHWNTPKYGASQLRIPHAKEFLRNLSVIWTRAHKRVHQSCPRP
jgi:hypothetical protein